MSCASIRTTEGVVILDVADGSLAQSLGFQRGDVIASVNDEKIARTRDLDRIVKDSNRRWAITLIRGGQTISVRSAG